MPTFTALALDRLLEPGASKSVDKSVPLIPKPTKSASNSNLERSNSTSVTERKSIRPQISPALYATPEATPLPDSPSSSYPPSPYIINHKRRGPRLLKSYSEDDVASRVMALGTDKVNGNSKNAETKDVDSIKGQSVTFTLPDSTDGKHVNGVHGSPIREALENGSHDRASTERRHDGETRSSNGKLGAPDSRNGLAAEKNVPKIVPLNVERDGESEDFFDPQESMSYASSTDVEDNTVAESVKLAATTPVGEFYDAWEELSCDGGQQLSLRDVEAELREMRMNVLMEIEKRKQAEEMLNSMQSQWQRIRQQLALVGLTLPAFPSTLVEGEQLVDTDPAEELCQQVYFTRFVSESIGRGIAKAEMEIEMEAQIEAKNIEIARLWDRLHYYEAVNQEMSQRNQEAVEMARRNRQGRKRRQQWVWGSVAAAITLGTAALAWSYFPSTKGSSSADVHSAAKGGDSGGR